MVNPQHILQNYMYLHNVNRSTIILYDQVSQGLGTTKFNSNWLKPQLHVQTSLRSVSVLTTSVKILPYRPRGQLIRANV